MEEATSDLTTQQLMFSLLEIWKVSGKTQKEFCREKDLAYHKFHYWFKKYNDQARVQLSFVPVNLPAVSGSGKLERVYPDGRRLIFHQPVDASFLRALLA